MRVSLIIVTALVLVSSSCEKREELPFTQDSEGAVTSMSYQWKTSLSTDGTLIDGFLEQSSSYNRNVLFASQDGKDSKMAMLSTVTGEILWQWNDLFELDKDFDISRQYQYDNYLSFQHGPRFYILDLANGNTVQKERRQYYVTGMTGIDDTYFVTGNTALDQPQPYDGGIYVGRIDKLNEELLLKPAYSYEHVDGNGVTGFVTGVTASEDQTGDILVAYGFADALPDWKGNIFAGVYNYTKQASIFEKQLLVSDVVSYGSGTPIIYGNKVYFSPDRSIICLDLYTGKQLWKQNFPEGFTFSGFIIAEDKLLANCEDTYLYALDPDTGRQLWKEKSSGTSSKMSYLNGIVYFVGGGDGLLHAVEIETGKHLWRIQSPDLEVNSGAWFMPAVTVLPPEEEDEKGKVLVSSYLSAFCYEAAR